MTCLGSPPGARECPFPSAIDVGGVAWGDGPSSCGRGREGGRLPRVLDPDLVETDLDARMIARPLPVVSEG